MLALSLWLKSLYVPDEKVWPYDVIPMLFVVALICFWILVLMNFPPHMLFKGTRRTTPRQ